MWPSCWTVVRTPDWSRPFLCGRPVGLFVEDPWLKQTLSMWPSCWTVCWGPLTEADPFYVAVLLDCLLRTPDWSRPFLCGRPVGLWWWPLTEADPFYVAVLLDCGEDPWLKQTLSMWLDCLLRTPDWSWPFLCGRPVGLWWGPLTKADPFYVAGLWWGPLTEADPFYVAVLLDCLVGTPDWSWPFLCGRPVGLWWGPLTKADPFYVAVLLDCGEDPWLKLTLFMWPSCWTVCWGPLTEADPFYVAVLLDCLLRTPDWSRPFLCGCPVGLFVEDPWLKLTLSMWPSCWTVWWGPLTEADPFYVAVLLDFLVRTPDWSWPFLCGRPAGLFTSVITADYSNPRCDALSGDWYMRT